MSPGEFIQMAATFGGILSGFVAAGIAVHHQGAEARRILREREKLVPQGYAYDLKTHAWIRSEQIGPEHEIAQYTAPRERLREEGAAIGAEQAAEHEYRTIREAYDRAGIPVTVDWLKDDSYPGHARPVVRPRTVPRNLPVWGMPRPGDWRKHLALDGDEISRQIAAQERADARQPSNPYPGYYAV